MKFITIMVTVLGLLGAISSNAATGSTDIYSAYAPNDDVQSTFAVFSGKVQAFLREGTPPGGPSNHPTDFWLASREFNWRRAMASSSASLWNGVLNPAEHGDQRGGRLVFPMRIVSSETFTPPGVRIGISSNDPYTDGNGVFHPLGTLGYTPTLTSWSLTAVGIWWGADQIKGNGDDVVRTSGADPINELFYTGPGVAYAVNNQAGLDNVSAYMAPRQATFEVNTTVTVVRGDGGLILPAVTHRAGDNNIVPRIVVSADQRSLLVAPESTGSYLVQTSGDLINWATPSAVRVTANGQVASVSNTGNLFFRLRE